MVTRKCDRKIPTVSVKSNYNVEGNFKIDGSLIVNGNDISSLKPTSLNGVSGDVVLKGGSGVNIEKNGKTITISSSFDSINALKFVYCDTKPTVENAVRDTVYLVEKSLNFEAWMLSSNGKELKNLSSALQGGSGGVGEGVYEIIEEKFDTVEKNIEDINASISEQGESISDINSNISKIENELKDFDTQIGSIGQDVVEIKSTLDDIKSDVDYSKTKITEIQEQISEIKPETYLTFKIVDSTEEVENDAKSNVIYLIKNGDVYEEYIYIDEKAEIIGGVSNNIDMSQYVTIEQLNSKNYITQDSLTSINENIVTNTQNITNLTESLEELTSKIEGDGSLSETIENIDGRVDETEKAIEDIKSVTDNIDDTIDTKINDAKKEILSEVNNISFQPVDILPSKEEAKENVIYLVSKSQSSDSNVEDENVKDEYIFINGDFEKIGDSKVDLTGYVTEDFLENSQKDFVKSDVLSEYATIKNLEETYATKESLDSYVTDGEISELNDTVDGLKKSVEDIQSADYITSSEIENAGYLTSSDLDEYAKTDDLADYVLSNNLKTEVDEILKEYGIISDDSEINPPNPGGGENPPNPDSGPDTPEGDEETITEEMISNILEEKLQEKKFLNRGKNGYMTLSELIGAYESLEINTIYWVKDKSSIEQYIKNEDNKLMQISGNLNVKLTKPEDIDMWELPWSSDCIEFVDNLPELVDGSYLFQNCANLESFVSDTSNMTTAIDMFKGCSKLTNFNGQLYGLRKASGMFDGCKLSLESIENLIYSLEGKLPTGEEGEFEITIGFEVPEEDEGTLVGLDDEAREKGWTVTWLRHGTEEVTFQ